MDNQFVIPCVFKQLIVLCGFELKILYVQNLTIREEENEHIVSIRLNLHHSVARRSIIDGSARISKRNAFRKILDNFADYSDSEIGFHEDIGVTISFYSKNKNITEYETWLKFLEDEKAKN